MADVLRICIDGMGGSNAPDAVADAVLIASQSKELNEKIHFHIVGDESKLIQLFKNKKIPESIYTMINADSIILDEDTPMEALRNKESSMRKGIQLVKDGACKAFVSSGNTGAMMVMSKVILGSLDKVKRPAIIGILPSKQGKLVMLDLGANTECNEEALFQFALMGNCFAKIMLDNPEPKIAILNIGSEDHKGREVEAKTSQLLKESKLNFIGYIEADQILQGKADVIVTDGFSGNVALKASEGTAKFFLQLFKQMLTESWLSKIAALLLKKKFVKLYQNINPANYNGAMFIGLNGIVVKSHGSSEAQGIYNAIKVAIKLAEDDINQRIQEELHLLAEQGVGFSLLEKIKQESSKILKRIK